MQPLDTPEGALVYADWLLAQGNLHGELIVVQRARQSPAGRTQAARRELRRREEELLDRHGDELAGPLPDGARLAWRGGFVREAALSLDASQAADLAEVFARTSFAFLDRLELELDIEPEEPLADVIGALAAAKHLRALKLGLPEGIELELSGLPPHLERLDVVAPEGHVRLTAPAGLRRLSLSASGAELDALPKLERLVTNQREGFAWFAGAELHVRSEPYQPAEDLRESHARRSVVTVPGDTPPPVGAVAWRTVDQAGERAFVLFEGDGADVRRGLDRLRELPLGPQLCAAHRAWRLGSLELVACELRSKEPQTEALRMLATSLCAVLGRAVVEVVLSASNRVLLLRAYERLGNEVMGSLSSRITLSDPAQAVRDSTEAFRRVVDRALAVDPGVDALADALLELDGATPVAVHGALPGETPQPPCCTVIAADLESLEEEDEYDREEGDEDEEEEEDEDEERYAREADEVLVASGEPSPLPEWLSATDDSDDDEDEDGDDDPDEPHHDAADVDLEKLLVEGPVDLDEGDEEGVDRAVQLAHPEPFGTLEPDVCCEACRRALALEVCTLCGAEVCEACLATELPVACKECRGHAGDTATLAATVRPKVFTSAPARG